ncbi:MAG TPA: LuxR C-terminal-related transcriptional regulator [Chloroflexota bacterium]|nr:LuxR C-terminal-related transcriptional regulator [Chloroflexota bacterium]
MSRAHDAPAEPFSRRELLVLQLLAYDVATGQIAAALDLTLEEVETLIARATVRLGARDQREAVARARQRRLIL